MYSTRQLKPGMKMVTKKGFGFIFCVLLFFTMVRPVFAANLLDVYKRGEIVLKADPEFGKNVDWEEWFYHKGFELAVIPGGSIYVINRGKNNIIEFNKDGQIVREFGQRGQGPLDFIRIQSPSILDNKYLVVGEHPMNRKITLVDMTLPDTRHVKILKTKRFRISHVTALKNNKVAYISEDLVDVSKNEHRHKYSVIIKDAITKKEITVATYNFSYFCRNDLVMIFILTIKNLFHRVHIAKTGEGNLMVGSSEVSDIDIFSPDGKKIRTFDLKYEPIIVTEKYKRDFQQKLAKSLGTNRKDSRMQNNSLKSAIIDGKLFGRHLPYYRKIIIDADGNFLVFPNSQCKKECEISFRVYSQDGTYICTTKLNTGEFQFDVDDRPLRNIVFLKEAIYGVFNKKNSEDIFMRLVKIKY
jgi:hypothetical protein